MDKARAGYLEGIISVVVNSAMLFPKFLRKKYSLKRRNRYGIEDS